VVKVISHKAASPQQTDGSIVSAKWWQCALSWGHMVPPGEYDWTCASFDCFAPPKFTTQMANLSVQPFLHSSRQKTPIVFSGRPFPQKFSIPIGGSVPRLIYDSLAPSGPATQTASRSVLPFCRAH